MISPKIINLNKLHWKIKSYRLVILFMVDMQAVSTK